MRVSFGVLFLRCIFSFGEFRGAERCFECSTILASAITPQCTLHFFLQRLRTHPTHGISFIYVRFFGSGFDAQTTNRFWGISYFARSVNFCGSLLLFAHMFVCPIQIDNMIRSCFAYFHLSCQGFFPTVELIRSNVTIRLLLVSCSKIWDRIIPVRRQPTLPTPQPIASAAASPSAARHVSQPPVLGAYFVKHWDQFLQKNGLCPMNIFTSNSRDNPQMGSIHMLKFPYCPLFFPKYFLWWNCFLLSTCIICWCIIGSQNKNSGCDLIIYRGFFVNVLFVRIHGLFVW